MSSINWNQGQLISLKPGDNATCAGNLNQGQMYGLFFYNDANNDTNANVTIAGNGVNPPVTFTVPGTTGDQGLAAICFVSGDDTSSISATLLDGQPGASVKAFIGSVKMPVDTTGINNQSLPLDGQPHAFNRFTRYYTVPESHWYTAQVYSTLDTFLAVQFTEDTATVICVNVGPHGVANVIQYYGSAKDKVDLKTTTLKSTSWNLYGDGTQYVWINADSVQDSKDASISVQSLENMFIAAKRDSRATAKV